MQTKMLAIGFALSYMNQVTTNNCLNNSALTGYNTLLPKNMAGDTNSNAAITSAALCATNATWTFQAGTLNSGTACRGTVCQGYSQPFFGIVEDWANGAAVGGVALPAPIIEYYILGSMEYAIDATAPGYGNGAYEARIIKLQTDNGNYITEWDTATAD